MAVAVQASNFVTGDFVSSINCNVTVGGSNKVMVASMGARDVLISSASGGGATWAVVPNTAATNTFRTVLWRGIAPTDGAQTITATFANADGTSLSLGAVQFTGADQTTPCQDGATATGTSTAPSVTVLNTTADDFVIDCAGHGGVGGATGSPGTGQTEVGTSVEGYAGISTQDGADGGVMSWSSSESLAWAISACRVVAASVAGAIGWGLLLAGSRNRLVYQ